MAATDSSAPADTPQADTPASSPPADDGKTEDVHAGAEDEESRDVKEAQSKEEQAREKRMSADRKKDKDQGKGHMDKKFAQLELLLNQSKAVSEMILSQMRHEEEVGQAQDEKERKKAEKREQLAEKEAEASQRRATRRTAGDAPVEGDKALPKRGRGRPKKENSKISDFFSKEDLEAKVGEHSAKAGLQEDNVKAGDIGFQSLKSARQPDLVTGGAMRSYQLEGLEWLSELYRNGMNGILADEMGLGKTIQTIAFLAWLRGEGPDEPNNFGPFLIAAPLSTTSNWVSEFQKWTPDIPVVLYHGSKDDRAKIRRTKFKKIGSRDFPVVITSYEICMNDKKFLAQMGWKFIIIDEGHRIKNLDCKLIRDLQTYQSANRLLITGTPLQNNLAELWSLLHFLMPDIFQSLAQFESWFDFSAVRDKQGYQEMLSEEKQQKLVVMLHAILKPFLLRRVKTDVEKLLPKKREYVLYAPLTEMQRDLYQAILDGTSRAYLEEKAVERISMSRSATPVSVTSRQSLKRKALDASRDNTPSKSAKTSREGTPALGAKGRRKAGARKSYEEVSDAQYFKQLEDDEANDDDSEQKLDQPDASEEEDLIVAKTIAMAKKAIANKKLQNPIMQLRLCCNSPHNFFNPFDLPALDDENAEIDTLDETLVTASGKMMLLDNLLPSLFETGHKVLIFSQFKSQLDLLQLYAEHLRGWRCCRIDGTVAQSDRQQQINAFNKPAPEKRKANMKRKRSKAKTLEQDGGDEDGEDQEPSNLFLLSTRAGGQGINLASADTVILFDSDWNPQQDLQAQDRAHRIGQTRNVIVYRFATRNTVEQTLLESAEGKRRLEKLVIRKGGLREGRTKKKRDEGLEDEADAKVEMEELQRLLRKEDGEKFEFEQNEGGAKLLSDNDLKTLLDRSDEAYERAAKGEDAGDAFKAVKTEGGGGLLQALTK